MVSIDFRHPIVLARLWHTPEPTLVAVPKTAVNKDNLLHFVEDEIGLSRQAGTVASKSVTV
jgi:hypothetical protein